MHTMKIAPRKIGANHGKSNRRQKAAARASMPPFGQDPMDKIAGFIKGGPTNASETVDEIVYGLPRSKRVLGIIPR